MNGLNMPPEKDKTQVAPEQDLKVIIEIFKSISNSLAVQNRLVMDFMKDQQRYRTEREKAEQNKMMSTTERIQIELKKRFEPWEYFRERVLPAIYIAIIIAILKRIGLL